MGLQQTMGKTNFTARFARGAEKYRMLKANKQDAFLCVLYDFIPVLINRSLRQGC